MTEEERYAKVENDKQSAINQSNKVYNDLLVSNNQLAQQQKDYINNWQQTQSEIADKNASYQTEIQNQNKVKAENEFKNEAIASKNAYYDFINPYGAQAEIQANNGLRNSGYSETTKLGAWNTQQNRTATARATMNDAKLQYDNAIKEIELNRDTIKAQYVLEALQRQLEASISEFNTSSQLQQGLLSNSQALDSEYNNRYNDVWNQITTEKEQAEAIRQYNQNYLLQEKQIQEDIRQFDENIAYLKEKDAKENELQIKQLEEKKRQAQQEQANWEREYQLSLQKMYSSNSGGGSGSNYIELTDNYNNSSLPQITTDYYSGPIHPDAYNYGTFSNGYQPDNIGGSKLSSSGKKVHEIFANATGSTGASLDNQTVWSTNGRYYIWDGSINDYIDVTDAYNQSIKTGTCLFW